MYSEHMVLYRQFLPCTGTGQRHVKHYVYARRIHNVRAVPEIIMGAAFFSDPLHPQDSHGVRAPRPPGHVSALISPAPLWIKYALTPRTTYPPPPLGRVVNKTPPPHRTKKCPPRIISGTALTGSVHGEGSWIQDVIISSWCSKSSPARNDGRRLAVSKYCRNSLMSLKRRLLPGRRKRKHRYDHQHVGWWRRSGNPLEMTSHDNSRPANRVSGWGKNQQSSIFYRTSVLPCGKPDA